jgi:hypothetical protein
LELEQRDTTRLSEAKRLCDLLDFVWRARTLPSARPQIMGPVASHTTQMTAEGWGNLLQIA